MRDSNLWLWIILILGTLFAIAALTSTILDDFDYQVWPAVKFSTFVLVSLFFVFSLL